MDIDRLLPPAVVLTLGAASAYAFSPAAAGRPAMLGALLGANLLVAAVALYRMLRDGTLLDLFRFRSGDIALGAFIALALLAAVLAGRHLLAPPGSPNEAWVIRIYLQIGELPEGRKGYAWLSAAVVVTAVCEELAWRGLVQQILEERLGTRRGWLLTTALYGLAQLPSVFLLAMPPAGKNPLLVVASLFCGLVWGFVVGRIQRLPPALLSHALFTYAVAVQFRLWQP